jgi:hypothetical protein
VVIEGPALLVSLKSSVAVIDAKKPAHFLFAAAAGFPVSSIWVASCIGGSRAPRRTSPISKHLP